MATPARAALAPAAPPAAAPRPSAARGAVSTRSDTTTGGLRFRAPEGRPPPPTWRTQGGGGAAGPRAPAPPRRAGEKRAGASEAPAAEAAAAARHEWPYGGSPGEQEEKEKGRYLREADRALRGLGSATVSARPELLLAAAALTCPRGSTRAPLGSLRRLRPAPQDGGASGKDQGGPEVEGPAREGGSVAPAPPRTSRHCPAPAAQAVVGPSGVPAPAASSPAGSPICSRSVRSSRALPRLSAGPRWGWRRRWAPGRRGCSSTRRCSTRRCGRSCPGPAGPGSTALTAPCCWGRCRCGAAAVG